jgi:hypothetical protein
MPNHGRTNFSTIISGSIPSRGLKPFGFAIGKLVNGLKMGESCIRMTSGSISVKSKYKVSIDKILQIGAKEDLKKRTGNTTLI